MIVTIKANGKNKVYVTEKPEELAEKLGGEILEIL